MLEQLGCKVLACTTPEEAVSCLKDQAFDFVVVNQGSRAFEGRSVVEQAMKTNPRARVLVLTRCVDMECYLEAMQLGAVDYVEKPLKALDLRRAAGRGLASCREAA